MDRRQKVLKREKERLANTPIIVMLLGIDADRLGGFVLQVGGVRKEKERALVATARTRKKGLADLSVYF